MAKSFVPVIDKCLGYAEEFYSDFVPFLCCFGQLRTQALASLHSGLQINQGIPIAHVAKWLGMEVNFFRLL